MASTGRFILAPRSADVLSQEFERALAREPGGRRVVGPALVAIESVVRWIDEDLLIAVLRSELFHALHRDHRVAFAEVAHHRAAQHDIGIVEDAAAVIWHRT